MPNDPWAQFNLAPAPGAPAGNTSDPWAQFNLEQLAEKPPLIEEQRNFNQSVVRGLQHPFEEAARLGTRGAAALFPSAEPGVEAVDKYVKGREEAFDKATGGKPSSFGLAVGEAAPLALMGAAAPGAAAESLFGRLLSGIGSGAVGGALQPTPAGPDFWSQKGYQAAEGAAGGAAGVPLAAGAARVISPATNPNVKTVLGKMGEGGQATPGQILGGIFNDLEQKFTSVPGFGDAIKNARSRATEAFDRTAINRTLGNIDDKLEKTTPLGREAISEMHDKVTDYYGKLLPKLTWQADPEFVTNVTAAAKGANLLPDQKKQFFGNLSDQFSKADKTTFSMPGEKFKEVDSKLGQLAWEYSNSPDPDHRNMGRAYQAVQVEFRDALRRSNPAHADELTKADAAYADMLRVQGAAGRQGAKEGVFSPAHLSSSVRELDPSLRHGAFARGEARMQDLSDAGRAVLGPTVPDSGTPGRMLTSGVTGLTTGLALSPLSALYTRPGQAMMRTVLARRPDVAAPIASVVRRAGVPASAGLGAMTPSLASVLASQPSQ